MFAVDDLREECRAHRVHVIRGKDAGGKEINRIVITGLFVVVRGAKIVALLPEVCGVNSPVFNFSKRDSLGVDVVKGEKRFDIVSLCNRRNEACHPVIAVNEVRPDLRDRVVDDFALKGEGNIVVVFRAVDSVAVEENTILGQVNVLFR